MICGWCEQMQPGGSGGVYTLVFATLCCQDTVRIMPYSFSMPDETVATRPPWLDSSLPRLPCRCISGSLGHNSTVSRQLRYSLTRESVPQPVSRDKAPCTVAECRLIGVQCRNSMKKKNYDDKAPPLCYNQLKALYFCKYDTTANFYRCVSL